MSYLHRSGKMRSTSAFERANLLPYIAAHSCPAVRAHRLLITHIEARELYIEACRHVALRHCIDDARGLVYFGHGQTIVQLHP